MSRWFVTTVWKTFTCYMCLIHSLIDCGSVSDPLQEAGILWTYRVSNSYQCRRLCWYRKVCVRFSVYVGVGQDADNCILYASSDPSLDLPDGWRTAVASGAGLGAGNRCQHRPCSVTETCMPRKTKVPDVICVDTATEMKGCVSTPCQNGGNCTDVRGGYTCHCPLSFIGDQCQTATWLRSACEGDGDCEEPLTACFSGQCLCTDGFFFSYSANACVSDCSALHDTYLHYRRWDLLGYDQYSRYGVDGDACKRICNKDEKCLVTVFSPKMLKCFVKYITAQQYPSRWKAHPNAEAYQRTCV